MEMHKTIGVVIENEGKFLLLKRAQNQSDAGKWAIPGGHLEERETPNIAAIREMQEEVGGVEDLEEVGMPFVHDVDSPRKGPHQHICHLFRATKSNEPVVETREADDWAWFKPDEIVRLELADWTKKVLKDLKIIK